MRINDLVLEGASINRIGEQMRNDGFGLQRISLWEGSVGGKKIKSESLAEVIEWVKKMTKSSSNSRKRKVNF